MPAAFGRAGHRHGTRPNLSQDGPAATGDRGPLTMAAGSGPRWNLEEMAIAYALPEPRTCRYDAAGSDRDGRGRPWMTRGRRREVVRLNRAAPVVRSPVTVSARREPELSDGREQLCLATSMRRTRSSEGQENDALAAEANAVGKLGCPQSMFRYGGSIRLDRSLAVTAP